MRVLVTGGGCEEPIDGVRFIANFSTGGTAACIADELLRRGHDVTLLAGIRALLPKLPTISTMPSNPETPETGSLKVVSFRGFAELNAALDAVLDTDPAAERFGLVVHAAAVSDYSVASVESEGMARPGGTDGKLKSGSEIIILLKPNPKLVDTLKARARCPVVAFKLTNGANETERLAAVSALLERSGADYAVSNDLSELSGERHPFRVYRAANRTPAETVNLDEPAESVEVGEPVEQAAFGHTKSELARFIAKLAGHIAADRQTAETETAYQTTNKGGIAP